MTERETVDNWLAGLAAHAGIEGLALDERGCVALRHGDALQLQIELPEGSPVAHLYAPVLKLADDGGDAASLRRLLALNLFGLETQGASFALDELSECIVLQYPLLVEATDPAQFERVLGNFIEAAAHWQRELAATAGGEAQEAASEAVAAPPAFNTMMLRI